MRILLVQTAFIGDVALSTPVIAGIRSLYPNAEIFVLTTEVAKDLVSFHPEVSDTITFDKRGADSGVSGLLRTARRLKEHNFSVVFSLHKSWRTAALLYLAGIPTRYGFAEARGRILYSKVISRSGYKHEVERNLAILCNENPGIDFSKFPLQVKIPDEIRETSKALLAGLDSSIIGIAPGSVWETKRWPIERYIGLVDRLLAAGRSVVVIGGPSDKDVGEAVQLSVGCHPQFRNLIGQTSILSALAVIDQMNLLVTNDSAPLHFASALGIPTVAVFCATTPEMGYGPWGTRSITIGVDNLFCRPCGRHGSHHCPLRTNSCREEISVDVVYRAVAELSSLNGNRV